jgi:hypothetical protein
MFDKLHDIGDVEKLMPGKVRACKLFSLDCSFEPRLLVTVCILCCYSLHIMLKYIHIYIDMKFNFFSRLHMCDPSFK